jgi:hypothetical protein
MLVSESMRLWEQTTAVTGAKQMLDYYGTRISDHQSSTPEGFLVCHDAPLARTATTTPQKYRGSEIGLRGDQIVDVYRMPEEVLSKKFLASLEGKIITDQHPSEFVSLKNAKWYSAGHVQNVRPGPRLPDGEQSIIGDLVITDEALIDKIRSGVRELSVGYRCAYIANGDGTYSQIKLEGNHVAVVNNGRAGEHVRIMDADSTSEEMLRSAEPDSFDKLADELQRRYNPDSEEIEIEQDEEENMPKIDMAEIKRIVREEIARAMAKHSEEPAEIELEDAYDEHPSMAKLRRLRPMIEEHGTDDEKRAYNNAVLALRKIGRSQSRLISAVDSNAQNEQARIKSQRVAAEFDSAVRRTRAKLRGEPEPDAKPAFGIRTADSSSRNDDEEWGVACERLRQEIRENGLGSKR